MNQQLENVFKDQESHQLSPLESPTKAEQRSFLLFSVGISQFLLPIEQIKEVTEFIPIRAYPTTAPKHLGVVNIRGEVVPVLSMTPFLSNEFDESKFIASRQASRLIILTCKEGTCFSVLASSAKKINHVVDPNQPAQTAVTLNGNPVRLLTTPEIIEKVGISA